MRKKCPICDGVNKTSIYDREFSSMNDITPFKKYTVSFCNNCGLLYSSDIVQNMSLKDYYTELSKYETEDFFTSKSALKEYNIVINIISKYIEKKSCIVDIGCGNGNLLSLLKLNGYNNIIGIEPSEKNVDHIRKDLGILAYVGSIGNDNLTINEKFDLIVMTGVLEHIIDLKSFLCECLRYLKNDGYICITVPDVMQFINNDDLYQQFSVEHINFFTKKTLEQIFGRFGVSNIYYDNSLDGAIVGLYKFDNMYKSDSYIDYDGKKMIQQYIGNMNVTKQRIESVINRYRNKKLYVWGCGTHTAMLFQLGMLKNIDIVGIIDSNINYNGKIVNGYEVMYPSKTLNSNYPILISSKLAQESIKNDITNKYALLNDIICLYN